MCECCSPKTWAIELAICGIIFILVRLYTTWDIFVVIGALMVIKAIWLFFMPSTCTCDDKPKKKK